MGFSQIPLPNAANWGDYSDILQRMMTNKEIGPKIALTQAQTKEAEAKSQLPFGGIIPPGPAGQVVGLQMVKNLYGEDSPQYKQAKNQFDLNQQSTQSRIGYQDALAGSLPKRTSTNLGKLAQEAEDVNNGYLPGSKIPIPPDQIDAWKGKYGLAILKPTTDTDTRKKNLYAHNMDITINKINPEHLTQYSGPEGTVNFLKDATLDQKNKAPQRYKDYQNAITNAKLLAKQVRQFYGTSITPEMDKQLNKLTNPSSFLKSPEVAMENFNSFIDTLRSETKTYQQATQSPDIYSGNSDASGLLPQSNASASNIERGKMKIIDSNGQEWTINRDKLDEAKKIDPGLKVKKEAFSEAKI